MGVRKLLLFFFACALMVPVSSATHGAKSAADQRLYEKARKACSGPQYPSGARPLRQLVMNCTVWLPHSVKIGLLVTLIFPLVALATAPTLAQGLEAWNKPCLKEYKKWKTLAKHKAFAVSNSNAGAGLGQSCAYSYSYPTKAGAEAAAIKACQTEKRYRSGRCYVMKSE